MLRLQSQTDPGWVERAVAAIPEILLDHAHCEKKAASTALSLVFRYPEHQNLVHKLTRLAREELGHFEEVLEHLQKRGLVFARQKPSPYAGKLLDIVREREPERLLDTLLCCAYIEARSCERMQLLAEALTDSTLSAFYRALLVSEARHHSLFVELARDIFPEAQVSARLLEIGVHEAAILQDAPNFPRLHN